MTEQDKKALTSIVKGGRTEPAFYKDSYHWDRRAVEAARILERHGVRVRFNGHAGMVSFEDTTAPAFAR